MRGQQGYQDNSDIVAFDPLIAAAEKAIADARIVQQTVGTQLEVQRAQRKLETEGVKAARKGVEEATRELVTMLEDQAGSLHQVDDITAVAIGVPISAGVATYCAADAAFDALLDRADQALYRAKRDGRNRVVLATIPVNSSAVSSPPKRARRRAANG